MKKRIEITIKCDTAELAAEALEEIAAQIRGAGFDRAPNDIREFEGDTGVFGFHYEVMDNDGTDMYGNDL